MDPDLQDKWVHWRSAFMDVLVDHFDPTNDLETIPPGMRDWKSDIVDDSNKLTEWLTGVIEVTGRSADATWLDEIRARFDVCQAVDDRIPMGLRRSEVNDAIKSFLMPKAMSFAERTSINGVSKNKVWRGVRLVPAGGLAASSDLL